MIKLALASLRHRVAASLATFIAVLLGSAILIACGGLFETAIRLDAPPQRLAGAPVVITGPSGFALPDQESETVAYAERSGVDAGLAARIAAIPGIERAVPDVSFPAVLPGSGTVLAGHSWESAVLTPFTLTAGVAPRAGQVVLNSTSGTQPGDKIDIVVAGKPASFTVSGVARGSADAVFFSAEDTQKYWSRPGMADLIGVFPGNVPLDELTRQLPSGVSVLTGDGRGAAEFGGIAASFLPLILLAAIFGGMMLVVMGLVVAATISLSAQQRQRELALLRATGATPTQVHRMVVAETMAVSLLAAVGGIGLGSLMGEWIYSLSVARGVVPAALEFHQGLIPFAGGTVVALAIAWLAAHLAARVAARARPIQALAAAENPASTRYGTELSDPYGKKRSGGGARVGVRPVRVVLAKFFGAATVVLAASTAFLDPETASSVGGPALLTGVIAVGLMAPWLVAKAAGLISHPTEPALTAPRPGGEWARLGGSAGGPGSRVPGQGGETALGRETALGGQVPGPGDETAGHGGHVAGPGGAAAAGSGGQVAGPDSQGSGSAGGVARPGVYPTGPGVNAAGLGGEASGVGGQMAGSAQVVGGRGGEVAGPGGLAAGLGGEARPGNQVMRPDSQMAGPGGQASGWGGEAAGLGGQVIEPVGQGHGIEPGGQGQVVGSGGAAGSGRQVAGPDREGGGSAGGVARPGVYPTGPGANAAGLGGGFAGSGGQMAGPAQVVGGRGGEVAGPDGLAVGPGCQMEGLGGQVIEPVGQGHGIEPGGQGQVIGSAGGAAGSGGQASGWGGEAPGLGGQVMASAGGVAGPGGWGSGVAGSGGRGTGLGVKAAGLAGRVKWLVRVTGLVAKVVRRPHDDLAVINTRSRAVQFAAVLTPITLAVAIALGNIYAQTTKQEAATAGYLAQIEADAVVSSVNGGIAPELVADVRGVPGVSSVTELVSSRGWIEEPYDSRGSDPWSLMGIDGDAFVVPVTAGSMGDLAGNSVALPASQAEELGLGVGAEVKMRLGDGAQVQVKVVALLDSPAYYGSLVLPADLLAKHTTAGLPSELLVRGSEGVAEAVGQRLRAWPGTTVGETLAVQSGLDVEGWINYLLAALAIAYAAIAAVNALVVSVLARRREFDVQRLVGATRRQVTRMLLVESGIVAMAGLVLGSVIAGISVVSMTFAVGSVVPSGPIWVFLAVVAATFLIVWPATVIAARYAMRNRPEV